MIYSPGIFSQTLSIWTLCFQYCKFGNYCNVFIIAKIATGLKSIIETRISGFVNSIPPQALEDAIIKLAISTKINK